MASSTSPESAVIYSNHVTLRQNSLPRQHSSQLQNSIPRQNSLQRQKNSLQRLSSYDDETLSFHSARSDSEFSLNQSNHSLSDSLKRLSLSNKRIVVQNPDQKIQAYTALPEELNSERKAEFRCRVDPSKKFNNFSQPSPVPVINAISTPKPSMKTRPKNLPGIKPV